MNIIHVQFNVLQLYKGILATIAAGCGFKYIKKSLDMILIGKMIKYCEA